MVENLNFHKEGAEKIGISNNIHSSKWDSPNRSCTKDKEWLCVCSYRDWLRSADCFEGQSVAFVCKEMKCGLQYFLKKEIEVNNYDQKDMGCIPLFWSPERRLECSPAAAGTLQLMQHTWERIGRTSGMALCQRQFCCIVLSPLLVLAERMIE